MTNISATRIDMSKLGAFDNVRLAKGCSGKGVVQLKGDVLAVGSQYRTCNLPGRWFRGGSTKEANRTTRERLLESLAGAFGCDTHRDSDGKVVFSQTTLALLKTHLGDALALKDFKIDDAGRVASGRPLTERRIVAIVRKVGELRGVDAARDAVLTKCKDVAFQLALNFNFCHDNASFPHVENLTSANIAQMLEFAKACRGKLNDESLTQDFVAEILKKVFGSHVTIASKMNTDELAELTRALRELLREAETHKDVIAREDHDPSEFVYVDETAHGKIAQGAIKEFNGTDKAEAEARATKLEEFRKALPQIEKELGLEFTLDDRKIAMSLMRYGTSFEPKILAKRLAVAKRFLNDITCTAQGDTVRLMALLVCAEETYSKNDLVPTVEKMIAKLRDETDFTTVLNTTVLNNRKFSAKEKFDALKKIVGKLYADIYDTELFNCLSGGKDVRGTGDRKIDFFAVLNVALRRESQPYAEFVDSLTREELLDICTAYATNAQQMENVLVKKTQQLIEYGAEGQTLNDINIEHQEHAKQLQHELHEDEAVTYFFRMMREDAMNRLHADYLDSDFEKIAEYLII